MNFTFSYPDDFESLPALAPQLQGCLTIPLRLKGKSDRPYERILISEIDYDCLRRDTPEIGDLTKSAENDLMKVYGDLEVGEPTKFLLDGYSAAFVQARAKVNSPLKGLEAGMTLYGAQTCTVVGHRAACWNVLSSDPIRLKPLLAGKVAFKGRSAQAWIPHD